MRVLLLCAGERDVRVRLRGGRQAVVGQLGGCTTKAGMCACVCVSSVCTGMVAVREATSVCVFCQADFQADLDFVRAACITTEVNMARVFNHDVKLRREAKAKLEG